MWIIAVSSQEATCQSLQFSYGVHPVCEDDHPANWTGYIRTGCAHGIQGELAISPRALG